MTDSIQTKLARVRPPRVHITYDLETDGVIAPSELPFIVGILADLKGETPADAPVIPLAERCFTDIDRNNFDDVLRAIAPGVRLPRDLPDLELPAETDDRADSHLRFTALADFDPSSLIHNVPALRKISLARTVPDVTDQRVAQLDAQLSAALSSIMHMPGFRQLEASWRGLHYLVSRSATNTPLRLKVLNVTKAELQADLAAEAGVDQGALFRHLADAEQDGSPHGLLVADLAIDGSAADIGFIRKMADVAAAVHAPFIAAASPGLLGLKDFDALARPHDPGIVLSHRAPASWRDFQATEQARYVALVLPRVLLRLPYGKSGNHATMPCAGLDFEELAAAAPAAASANLLWGNAAYVLAERIANAVSLYAWPAAIRGAEGGGLVEELAAGSYTADAGAVELFGPTEATIDECHEKELSDLGLVSLRRCKGTAMAAFFCGQHTGSRKTRFSDAGNADVALTLPYVLAASRFAHYVKAIMRKKVGTVATRANLEQDLNRWIASYVLLDENATHEAKAARPLRAANVAVTEVPGKPGCYLATLFLKPHFQLEDLPTSIRLVATLNA